MRFYSLQGLSLVAVFPFGVGSLSAEEGTTVRFQVQRVTKPSTQPIELSATYEGLPSQIGHRQRTAQGCIVSQNHCEFQCC